MENVESVTDLRLWEADMLVFTGRTLGLERGPGGGQHLLLLQGTRA